MFYFVKRFWINHFLFFILDHSSAASSTFSGTSDLDVGGRVEALLSFYEMTSDADHGPFDHVQRQKKLAAGVEVLPMLLHDAREGRISKELLKPLKYSILHLARSLPLEWFTSSVLKGMDVCYFVIIYLGDSYF